VGQIQLRNSQLVTGGSDGSVRVWSLETYQPIHRLAAHDNSVTSLQFDDTRIVSGGSDGRVKIWDLRTGMLIRELSQPADAVWRVAFEEERSVVLASRHGRTVMEVWDFTPPIEDEQAEFAMIRPLEEQDSSSRGRFGNASGQDPANDALMDDIQQLAYNNLPEPSRVENVDMVDAYTDVSAPTTRGSCGMID